MIDKEIIKAISKRNGYYNFNDLLTLMEKSGISFIARKLAGPIAIATLDGVIVDISKFEKIPDSVVFFIFIHEISHMKRINKYGKEWFLGQLSLSNYDKFLEELFKEEILADRYACRIFYRLNKFIYPWCNTQQLNLKHKQDAYEPLARSYYGKIKNDEATYRKLIQSFIK